VFVPDRCFTRVGSSLALKYKTRLERLDKDKHSCLLRKSVNYGHKKFYSTGPRGLEKHLDDPIPNGDFPVINSFGIISPISDIISYHLGKYY
jgi:hypothetical protein